MVDELSRQLAKPRQHVKILGGLKFPVTPWTILMARIAEATHFGESEEQCFPLPKLGTLRAIPPTHSISL